ncbi:MAG TPA: VOC family protein [Clostridia bacterium]
MNNKQTFRGLATVSFYAADVEAAKKWYTELLSVEPYFERPGYVEFRIGDYQSELGIIDARFAPKGMMPAPTGSIVYWHVDNVLEIFDKLIAMGAKEYEAIRDRSGGFVTASVVDPFGNILGIMHNPHYIEILNLIKKE